MRSRHLISTLLAATLAGCGASGIASDSGSNAASGPAAPVAQTNSPAANNGAQDFLARSGFLGFSSVSDKAIGQNRFLVYTTRHKLLTADTNDKEDVYLRDLRTGKLELISVSSSEAQANGASNSGSISADGRYVAFRSAATNLVAGDNNGLDDIFVRDVLTGTTVRVSVSSSGTESNGASLAPAISNKNGVNGPYVVFSSTATNLVASDSNGASDIFVRDIAGNATTLVSSNSAQTNSANGGSFDPAITPDGALIAFSTDATNVLSGTLNGQRQVVRIDRATPSTRVLISQSASGNQADRPCYEPSMSDNGQVAFFTLATNLGVAADTNGFFDVYVRDVGANTVSRVSLDSGGGESNGHSGFPSISGDGSVVAFASLATDLVAGDTNGVFDVFSRTGGVTTRTSVSTAGTEADVDSDLPAISQDGRHIAFRSAATNLIAADPLADDDISVRDRTTPSTFWGTVRCLFPAVWPGFGVVASGTTSSSTPDAHTVGDFNGDGNLDIASVVRTPSQDGSVVVNLGDNLGNFGPPTNFPISVADFFAAEIESGDFNNDGNLDLVVTKGFGSSSTAALLIGNGAGGFGTASSLPAGTQAHNPVTGDFNHDGNLDLIVITGYTLSVFLGNGAAGFTAATSPTVNDITSQIAADVNHDGNLDLAVSQLTTNNVSVLLGSGTGSFAAPVAFTTPGFCPMTLGDFNGDGHLDLVQWGSLLSLSVHLGDGSGNFGTGTLVSVPAVGFSRRIASADFDGDGNLDLALSYNPQNARVLLGNGTGNFSVASFTAGAIWISFRLPI
jgi:Tol biopolymer transport system component